MKSTISIILSLLLAVSLFTACANLSDSKTPSTPQQSEIVPGTDDVDVSQTDSGNAEQMTASDTNEPEISLPWEISEPQINYEETPENAVSFELVEDSLTAAGAEFKISNILDKAIATGNDFTIEVFKDGKWNYIDIGMVMFPAEAFDYEAGQTYDLSIDWTNYYGELPQSDYRIIKEYRVDGSPDKYYCICEFSIENE